MTTCACIYSELTFNLWEWESIATGVLQWGMRVLEGETELCCNERCVAMQAKHCNGRWINCTKGATIFTCGCTALQWDESVAVGDPVALQGWQTSVAMGDWVMLHGGQESVAMEKSHVVLQWERVCCIAVKGSWQSSWNIATADRTLQWQTEHCNGR